MTWYKAPVRKHDAFIKICDDAKKRILINWSRTTFENLELTRNMN